MEVTNVSSRSETKIESYPYRGVPLPVKEVSIRWLTRAGPADSPEYGLRFFTVGPGGQIPIHNHFYVQTMYVLSGRLAVTAHDPATDAALEEKVTGPGDFIFIPSLEPHSMRNPSDRESVTFLCCIANVYEDGSV